MNELVQFLASKANFGHLDENDELEFDHRLEKFTELIVRECAEVPIRNPHLSGYSVSDVIKARFGFGPRS